MYYSHKMPVAIIKHTQAVQTYIICTCTKGHLYPLYFVPKCMVTHPASV